jgi:putative ATP-dependent endonuclease of the OLD family
MGARNVCITCSKIRDPLRNGSRSSRPPRPPVRHYAGRRYRRATTDLAQLSAEDFHQRNTKDPVEITLTFIDLSAEAQQEFAEYYRQGKLVVSAIATFDESTGRAEVRQTGQRLVMAAFKEFFKAVGDRELVGVLRQHFSAIRGTFPEVSAASTRDGSGNCTGLYF